MLPVHYNVNAFQGQEELEKSLKFILMGTIFRSEYELQNYLKKLFICRIETKHYQIMYDAAQRSNNSQKEIDDAKHRVKVVLQDLMRDHFIGYGLVAMADFSDIEAQSIHRMFQWGMWIKVIPIGVTHTINQGEGLLETISKPNYKKIPYDSGRKG